MTNETADHQQPEVSLTSWQEQRTQHQLQHEDQQMMREQQIDYDDEQRDDKGLQLDKEQPMDDGDQHESGTIRKMGEERKQMEMEFDIPLCRDMTL
ncbi:unnamed protein product [Phytophthora fragariaefolia]|uniref:Unnamed protein product n=1 Tax=Phytophthora fragariaefolia TaxID=1490495 RepID=A0A9W6Y808_9STRA|nr:unnamed protein product [Phytophthora fragariaefolia]